MSLKATSFLSGYRMLGDMLWQVEQPAVHSEAAFEATALPIEAPAARDSLIVAMIGGTGVRRMRDEGA